MDGDKLCMSSRRSPEDTLHSRVEDDLPLNRRTVMPVETESAPASTNQAGKASKKTEKKVNYKFGTFFVIVCIIISISKKTYL